MHIAKSEKIKKTFAFNVDIFKTEIRHKTVERMAGAWYYHSIVSLFIEGEAYEQEK